jgi:hypothetical protein
MRQRKPSSLTPSERHTVAHALEVAAEQFERDAAWCALEYWAHRMAYLHAMARTFQLQAKENRALIGVFQ